MRRLGIALALIAACGCTQTPAPPRSSPIRPTEHSGHANASRDAFALAGAKRVGTVRAPEPSGDDIHLFRPILMAAYRKACPDVTDAHSQFRWRGRGRHVRNFVVVRCDGHAARAVRVVYTGVTVPGLVGQPSHSLTTLAAMLGLHIVVAGRVHGSHRPYGTIVRQEPSGGVVVPRGSTVGVFIAA